MQSSAYKKRTPKFNTEGEQRDVSRSKEAKDYAKAKRSKRSSKEKYYAYNS